MLALPGLRVALPRGCSRRLAVLCRLQAPAAQFSTRAPSLVAAQSILFRRRPSITATQPWQATTTRSFVTTDPALRPTFSLPVTSRPLYGRRHLRHQKLLHQLRPFSVHRPLFQHHQQQNNENRDSNYRAYDADDLRRQVHLARLRDAKPLVHWRGWRAVNTPSTYTVVAVAVAAALAYYFAHLETVPVSGRTRFNAYGAEAARRAGEAEHARLLWELEQKGLRILPAWDPRAARVRRVMRRLVPFSGLRDEQWEVFVVEDDRTANAVVLPGGKVFVFSGILGLAGNDSGLATVLGHEIAHNLAGHHEERLSQNLGSGVLLYSLVILAGAFGLAPILMHYFGSSILNVAFGLPMSRLQESEADYIGLMIMAEACYDPTEAVRFWARMERAMGEDALPEWMGTHPTNANRIRKIQEWLPKALEKRAQSDCSSTTAFADLFRQALRTGHIVITG